MITVSGASVDRHIGKAPFDVFGGAHRGLDVVDGEHERAGVRDLGGFEDLGAACVSVKGLRAEFSHELDLLGGNVEGDERDLLAAQDAGHDLTKAAEAGDDDVLVARWKLLEAERRVTCSARGKPALDREQQRSRRH